MAGVSRIAQADSTVYIHGESGTGKEVIAKAIHLASERKNKPFVAINCAAVPEALLESELFGHEKGSFTGAVRSTKGFFAQAHEGTILLDEIGDMPLSIQPKLLRALEERQFYPIGGEKPIHVDVRVIVATKKDLAEEVKKGAFSRRSVLPDSCYSGSSAAAAGTQRRYSPPGKPSAAEDRAANEKGCERYHAPSHEEADAA